MTLLHTFRIVFIDSRITQEPGQGGNRSLCQETEGAGRSRAACVRQRESLQTLLRHDLVDEFRLKIFPITLGKGKRLFAEGSMPAGFDLIESGISPKGVIIVADYVRAGDVKTGSFGQEIPSEAELTRREKLRKEAA